MFILVFGHVQGLCPSTKVCARGEGEHDILGHMCTHTNKRRGMEKMTGTSQAMEGGPSFIHSTCWCDVWGVPGVAVCSYHLVVWQ